MIKKRLTLSNNLSVRLVKFQEVDYLLLLSTNAGYYFEIPSDVSVAYNAAEKVIDIEANFESSSAQKLYLDLNNFCVALNTPHRKIVLLSGLGFRMQSTSDNILEFKLGKSHKDVLSLQGLNLNVRIKKQRMLVEGVNKCTIGNFLDRVISLKRPDSYKGKGFSLKYKAQRLKPIKK